MYFKKEKKQKVTSVGADGKHGNPVHADVDVKGAVSAEDGTEVPPKAKRRTAI